MSLSIEQQRQQQKLRQVLQSRGMLPHTAQGCTREALFKDTAGRRVIAQHMYRITGRSVTQCLAE